MSQKHGEDMPEIRHWKWELPTEATLRKTVRGHGGKLR
jgi:hypothetical protein